MESKKPKVKITKPVEPVEETNSPPEKVINILDTLDDETRRRLISMAKHFEVSEIEFIKKLIWKRWIGSSIDFKIS